MMGQLKQERLRVREQNHFLDLLMQVSPMGVIILNFGGEVTQLNPVAAKMLRVKMHEVIGKKMAGIATPLALALSTMELEETKDVRLEDANIYKCTYAYFIDQGFRHPFFLIERMTDVVMRAEKKAYEKVIRLIAHEVNNTTAGITSTLDTLNEALVDVEGTEDMRQVMQVCVERCYSMGRFITRFADVVKIPEPTLTMSSLNELATVCARFMEGICADRQINLQLQCSDEVNDVPMDVSLMEQVLVNIIKNSAESIGVGGDILIRTITPATIEVADNGKGIDQDTADRLFTPFFST
ncbi:two component system sensor histidine kinase, partial [gut metagenome]